jgi:hypothetical protein
MCPARPSLQWIPSARVPQFQQCYGSPRLLVIRPAALRIPSLGGTTLRRLAMQAWSDASLPARVSTGPRPVPFRGDDEASQIPGESLCACPDLGTPARPTAPRHYGAAEVAFRYQHAVGPRGQFMFSGLNNTAYTLAVYASQHGSPPSATQDLLPVGCLALSGRVMSPWDSNRSFKFS